MQTGSSLVIAAGLALVVVSPALAEPPISAGKRTDLRVERTPIGLSTPRDGQNFSGQFVTMRDELENFPVDTSLGNMGVSAPPTSFTGPPGFVWPNNNLRGQGSINFVRLVDLAGAPVSGANGVTNASKALRIFTGFAQPPGHIFTGASFRFGGGEIGESTLPLEPIPGVNARVSAEHWLSSIDSLYTFEPTSFTGFRAGRLLWGGTNSDTEFSIPPGIIDRFYVLSPNTTGHDFYVPAQYCRTYEGIPIPGCVPPPGFAVGDTVPPPIQNWFSIAAESTADGRCRFLLDLLDGSGEAAMYEHDVLGSGLFDSIGWNASFESQGSFMLVDNIEASGPLYQVLKPPPFECPYFDDIEWLNTGPVLEQSNGRWTAALSSAARVIDDGAGNRFLRQVNDVDPSNTFRQELSAELPVSYALPADPWTLCLDAATTLGESGHPTARAFALDSEATNYVPGGVTTRVYLGITDPDTGIADSTIYVQTNIEYDPYDDPTGGNQLDNPPVVGVDVASTGVQWLADGQFRTLCVTVANDNAMTVSIDGVDIYTGVALSIGATLLRVESENTNTGYRGRLDLDNIDLRCSALPVVSLPALTAPYLDDFGWGLDNIPPNRHIDDPANSPTVSTRFTNANGVVALGGAIAMRNVFTDTVQVAPPDPNDEVVVIFTQFTTRTPSIVVDADTGWRVEMTLTLSDFLTSRGFSPAQLSDVGGVFEFAGYLWISAVDQKVYLFASPQNATPEDDLLVIDTGFTLAALGVTPGAPFTARAEYNRATAMIDWSINGVAVGSTHLIVGTDDSGDPRVHRNLDGVYFWGGDDATAPRTPPFSVMTLDDLRVVRVVPCADANGDNIVNFTDLNAVLSSFGQAGAGLAADFNNDGVVNFADLNAVLAAFGTSCE